MRIVINTKLVRRNAKIGQYTSILALVILGAGLLITFRMPDRFGLSIICLLAGFVLSQVGIQYGNRWGRRPRPDEIIDKSLKGLGREYTIYHYSTPAFHLLAGPAGLWIILPYYQGGSLTYERGRFRLRGGGFAQGYLRLFGSEGIGRPDLEVEADIAAIKRFLKRNLPEGTEVPPVQAALLFANPRLQLNVEGAPLPAMAPKDLKDFLRRKSKEKPLPELQLEAIRRVLPQPQREE
jgi:hypothetical protein